MEKLLWHQITRVDLLLKEKNLLKGWQEFSILDQQLFPSQIRFNPWSYFQIQMIFLRSKKFKHCSLIQLNFIIMANHQILKSCKFLFCCSSFLSFRFHLNLLECISIIKEILKVIFIYLILKFYQIYTFCKVNRSNFFQQSYYGLSKMVKLVLLQ